MGLSQNVQITPGIPRTFAVELTTGWAQLPDLDNCISLLLRPRPGGSASIYVSNETGAGGLNRIELGAADPGLALDIPNPNLLYAAMATGTGTLEVVAILRVD